MQSMLRFCALFVLSLLPGLAAAELSGAVRVIDADTWEVQGTRVRIFGIDAPELNQECVLPNGAPWACGLWARSEARRLFQEKIVTCRAVNKDRFGRTVARCEVEGRDAGRFMVQEGIALAYRKYSMDYDLDEKRALVSSRGIHQGTYETPAKFRERRVSQAAPEGCRIKGNISSKGSRIYHVPGQADYDRTRISANKGERWFCSEAEARGAGWRRAKR